MAKVFHDVLYGDIDVSPTALRILDTPEFQRLRDISQTGAAQYVFPSATTSRFEHSLGTYALTGRWLSHLGMSRSDARFELICIGALVHDLGHGPFSHLFEARCLQPEDGPWRHHEVRSQDLFRRLAKEIFSPEDVEFVCEVIRPTTDLWFLNLVNNRINGIDSDKLDYIARDRRAFGLARGVDVQRLIQNSAVLDGEVCFCQRVTDELENLFYVRSRLYRDIYCHKTIQRVEGLLAEIVSGMRPCPRLTIRDRNADAFLLLTDVYVKAYGDARLWRRLARRQLPVPLEHRRPATGVTAFVPERIGLFSRKDKVRLPFVVAEQLKN